MLYYGAILYIVASRRRFLESGKILETLTCIGIAGGILAIQICFFRCSKSMILNADKIDYVHPSISGRFEAVLSNGETVLVSRKYVNNLKHKLGMWR